MTERKHDPKEIHLDVEEVLFGKDSILIRWYSDIGFGEYEIGIFDGKLSGDSECMDKGEDKAFLKELLVKASEYIVKNIEIIG